MFVPILTFQRSLWLYVFLNRLLDCHDIRYRISESLDLVEEDRLHFASEKVNKRSNLWGGGSQKEILRLLLILLIFLIKGGHWF